MLLHWWDPTAVQLLGMQGFDLYERLSPRTQTGSPVVIVDIDEKSLSQLGQWPWSRTVVAQLVNKLTQDKAAVIGFDIVFAEPDRLSPQKIAESIPGLQAKAKKVLQSLPSNDEVLAHAIQGHNVVLGRGLSENAKQPAVLNPTAAIQIQERGVDPRSFLTGWPTLLTNVPVLEKAAAGYGMFDLPAERDGVVRRIPGVFAVNRDLHLNLSLAMLRVGSGAKSFAIESDEDGIARIVMAQYAVPTDRRGRIWVNYAPLDKSRYLSASDVLAGHIDPARLAGKYVLIGTSALGLADMVPTPLGYSMPSVEVHAQTLETVLAHDFLSRSGLALDIERFVIFAAGILLIVLVPSLGAYWTLLAFAGVAVIMAATSWMLYIERNLLVDFVFPSLSVFSLYAALVFFNYRHEEFAKKRALLDYQRARLDEARLLQITNAISSELNLDSLLRQIIAAASDILDAERSSLFLYDAARDELWSRVGEGLDRQEIRFPADAGLAGACFVSGQAEHIPDAYADPRFNREFDLKTGFRTRNILSMPVQSKQGVKLGVIQVLNKKNDGAFDDLDESRLQAFCAQTAIALENAQLFDEMLNARNYNESILKSLSNGVITLDTNGRVIKANEAAARILDWHDAVPVDVKLGEVFSVENAWLAKSVDNVSRSGQPEMNLDAEIHLPNAKIVSVNTTTVPLIDVQERSIGNMLVLEDISREKRIKSTMSRYVARELVDQLVEAGEAVLGGVNREATILFSDIRSFTNISEQLGPRATVSILNDYFTDMVEIVYQRRGILDKYIGDALMAVFGIPFASTTDTDNALKAANDMMVTLRAFNQRHLTTGDPEIRVGVGIAKGEVVSGNIGSMRRMDYTVIGNSVNLAARLESATKLYKTPILLCEDVVASVSEPYRLREIDTIRAKGQDRAVSIYEALDHHTEETFPRLAETLEAFEQGLRHYRQRDWPSALSAFEAALGANPDDGPSALFCERCKFYLATPPDDGWDGVWSIQTN